MGELSFTFIARTQGEAAAQTAKETHERTVDAFTQCFGDYDGMLVEGEYDAEENRPPITSAEQSTPESFELRIYQLAGRVSIVANIEGVPTIEHRDYWPDPEIPSENRLYVHVLDWSRNA